MDVDDELAEEDTLYYYRGLRLPSSYQRRRSMRADEEFRWGRQPLSSYLKRLVYFGKHRNHSRCWIVIAASHWLADVALEDCIEAAA